MTCEKCGHRASGMFVQVNESLMSEIKQRDARISQLAFENMSLEKKIAKLEEARRALEIREKEYNSLRTEIDNLDHVNARNRELEDTLVNMDTWLTEEQEAHARTQSELCEAQLRCDILNDIVRDRMLYIVVTMVSVVIILLLLIRITGY